MMSSQGFCFAGVVDRRLTPAALYSGLMALPEPPRRLGRLKRSRSLSQIGGLRPTSLVERGAEGAPAPSLHGTRPKGRQGRSAAQDAARPACSQPGRPRPHSYPGSPGLADGQGSWRGPDPASNEAN